MNRMYQKQEYRRILFTPGKCFYAATILYKKLFPAAVKLLLSIVGLQGNVSLSPGTLKLFNISGKFSVTLIFA